MSPIASSAVVLAFVLTGAICGAALRYVLPASHRSPESKDAIRIALGLVGTMVALVLGLMVASAKGFYDAQVNELTQMSAQVVVLNRELTHYGPETERARELLRAGVANIVDQTWSHEHSGSSWADPAAYNLESLYDAVLQLTPRNEAQTSLRASALGTLNDLGRTRWLMFEQTVTGVPTPLLIVLALWLSLLFLSFGLFAPANVTVAVSMFLSALSVSAAILMILEMYNPYQGLIQVSSKPLREALAHLNR